MPHRVSTLTTRLAAGLLGLALAAGTGPALQVGTVTPLASPVRHPASPVDLPVDAAPVRHEEPRLLGKAVPAPGLSPVADRVALTPAGEVDLMVLTTSAASRARVLALGAAAGATVRHRRDAQGALTLRVARSTSTLLRSTVASLAGTSVELSAVRSVTATPNDEFYAKYQRPAMTQVRAEPAWELTHGSANVLIAVIDTGVDITHPDLVGKVAGTYNAVTGGTDVTDVVGHGTFVASVAAASTGNGIGLAGAGYDTRVLAVKVAGADNLMFVSDIVEGIRWATAQGADVINLSLGSASSSHAEATAVAAAQAAGVLVVAAAGNSGAKGNPVIYPAAYDGVVGVASVDAMGVRSSFSEYNDRVTVAAPGEDIAGAIPVAGSTLYPALPGYSAYRLGDGTSFAAPIVAAQAALLLAAAPQTTMAQLRAAIVGSAQAMPGKQVGAGLVDFRAALALLTPTTTPLQTAPLAGANLTTASFRFTAGSTARAVRFSLDGVASANLTPVVAGVAGVTLALAGWAAGPHTVTAVDCTLGGLCGPVGPTTTFTVRASPPLITLPMPAVLSGLVTLTATVSAATARWTLDGSSLGSPVPALGLVTTPWSTFGLSNGPHELAVSGCTLDGRCDASTTVTVTVANIGPAVLTPTVGQHLSGPLSLTAWAPGGGVRFLVDGRSVGFAATAPYALTLDQNSLDDGDHTVVAVSCDSSGATCSGPATTAQPFSLASLHPAVLVTGATPFSPNGDGVRDAVTYTVTLPESQQLALTVTTPDGTVVAAAQPLGTFPAGSTSLSWTGRTAGGAALPGGRYVLQVTASAVVDGRTLIGTATSTPVTVDLVAPTMTGLTASGYTFFPVKDGYLDTFAPLVTLNEGGTLTLTVRSGNGVVLKRLTGVRPVGRAALVWDGTNTAGRAVAAGRYQWQYTVTDVAGNTRSSSIATVVLSSARR